MADHSVGARDEFNESEASRASVFRGCLLMGVPNCQLTTNPANCQLTTIFLANCQLTTNFSYLLTFIISQR